MPQRPGLVLGIRKSLLVYATRAALRFGHKPLLMGVHTDEVGLHREREVGLQILRIHVEVQEPRDAQEPFSDQFRERQPEKVRDRSLLRWIKTIVSVGAPEARVWCLAQIRVQYC